MKCAQAGDSVLWDAFGELAAGGDEVVASLASDARATLEIMWSAAGTSGAAIPDKLLEQEVNRIATVFARWQTNQHEFPAIQQQQCRALYWLAPKVAHSCEPNVGWEDPDEAGRVELRALRELQAGEVLGVNYMDEAFLRAPVSQRRRRLRAERKFDCLCPRCLRELAKPSSLEAPTQPSESTMKFLNEPSCDKHEHLNANIDVSSAIHVTQRVSDLTPAEPHIVEVTSKGRSAKASAVHTEGQVHAPVEILEVETSSKLSGATASIVKSEGQLDADFLDAMD